MSLMMAPFHLSIPVSQPKERARERSCIWSFVAPEGAVQNQKKKKFNVDEYSFNVFIHTLPVTAGEA